MKTCIHCGDLIVACADSGDKIRYHSYTADPNFPIAGRPNPPSKYMTCKGWVHSDGWHMCDPSTDHTLLAEAA